MEMAEEDFSPQISAESSEHDRYPSSSLPAQSSSALLPHSASWLPPCRSENTSFAIGEVSNLPNEIDTAVSKKAAGQEVLDEADNESSAPLGSVSFYSHCIPEESVDKTPVVSLAIPGKTGPPVSTVSSRSERKNSDIVNSHSGVGKKSSLRHGASGIAEKKSRGHLSIGKVESNGPIVGKTPSGKRDSQGGAALDVGKVFSVNRGAARDNSVRRSTLLDALVSGEVTGSFVSNQEKSFLTQENLTELQKLAQKVSKKPEDRSGREGSCKKMQRLLSIARLRLWLFLEEPFDTLFSSLVSYTMVLIIVSAICHSIATMDRERLLEISSWRTVPLWDIVFNSIFFVDLLLRFWSYPSHCNFFYDPKNVIDVVCLIPFFLNGVLGLPSRASQLNFLRYLSSYEAFLRLLKLSRYFWGWRLLFHAILDSAKALIIPMLFLEIVVLFGSCSVYVFEVLHLEDQDAPVASRLLRGGGAGGEELVPMDNLPDSIHFCIISILGISTGPYYGLEAASALGRAAVCLILLVGMLFMAMPIAIVGSCFSQTWFDQDRIILLQKMRDRLRAQGYSPRDLEDVFDQVDENGSGELDFDNFRKMIATFNLRSLNAAKCRQLFHYFDNDADGVINLSDFALTLYPDMVDFDEDDSETDDWDISLTQYESQLDYDSTGPAPPAPVGGVSVPGHAPTRLLPVGEVSEEFGEEEATRSFHLLPGAPSGARLSDITEVVSPAVSIQPAVSIVKSVASEHVMAEGKTEHGPNTNSQGDHNHVTWVLPVKPFEPFTSEQSDEPFRSERSEQQMTECWTSVEEVDDACASSETAPIKHESMQEAALQETSRMKGDAVEDTMEQYGSLEPMDQDGLSDDSEGEEQGCYAVTSITQITSIGTDPTGSPRGAKFGRRGSSGDRVHKRESDGYDVLVDSSMGVDDFMRRPSTDSKVEVSHRGSLMSWDILADADMEDHGEEHRVRRSSDLSRVSHEDKLTVPTNNVVRSMSGTSHISDTPLRDHDPFSTLVHHEDSNGSHHADGINSINSAQFCSERGSQAGGRRHHHPTLMPIEAAIERMEASLNKRLEELKNSYLSHIGGQTAVPHRPHTSMFNSGVRHLGFDLGHNNASRQLTPRSSKIFRKKKDKRHHDDQDGAHHVQHSSKAALSRKGSLLVTTGNHSSGLADEDSPPSNKGHQNKRRSGGEPPPPSHAPHMPFASASAHAVAPPVAKGARRPSVQHEPPPATATPKMSGMPHAPPPPRPKKMLQRAKTTGFKGLLKKA